VALKAVVLEYMSPYYNKMSTPAVTSSESISSVFLSGLLCPDAKRVQLFPSEDLTTAKLSIDKSSHLLTTKLQKLKFRTELSGSLN
jgi:hypothetical protein